MDAYLLLLAESIISLIISLIVLSVLSRPLVNVLAQVCPDEKAAVFWLSYTKLMLVIAPLLLVLSVDLLAHFASPLDSLRLALMAALGGLLLGLHLIGKRLGQFVPVPKNLRSAA